MKWIFLFCFSFPLHAQKLLKSGIYQNQKFTEPVVLDTGHFVFRHVDFSMVSGKNAGPILLNASHASQLRMEHCSFQGLGKQTGIILGHADANLSFTTFYHLAIGIRKEGKGNLNLEACQFTDFYLAGIQADQARIELKNCTFSFSKGYAVSNKQKLKMPKTFPGKPSELPYGIHFANGGSGSLTFTGTNRLEGPFDVVSATSPAFTDLSGTAIRLAGQNFNLTGSVISKWKTGLLVRETTDEAIVRQNRFFGNQTAIDLSPQAPNTIDNMNLNLGCNRFDHRYIIQQPGQEIPFELTGNATGLRVGAGVQMQNIGGQGGPGFDPPAGNWWPVGSSTDPSNPYPPDPNDYPISGNTISGWQSPTGWNSILNESSNAQWRYWRFANEFVGNFVNNGPANAFFVDLTNFFLKTDASQANPANVPLDQILVNCGNFGLIEVFPTRQAVDSTLAPKPENVTWLGQNIPNPGSKSVSVPYHLAEKAEQVWLEVYDLGTGRILQHQYLPNEGSGSIELNLIRFASGLYGYRLMVDGQAKAWKKMAITR
jgi:hypothetical protein